jgi:hypothetical protein
MKFVVEEVEERGREVKLIGQKPRKEQICETPLQ